MKHFNFIPTPFDIIDVLSLRKRKYPDDTFETFFDYFDLEMQEKFIKEKSFTDEEFKYLFHIYILMKDYYEKILKNDLGKSLENSEKGFMNKV